MTLKINPDRSSSWYMKEMFWSFAIWNYCCTSNDWVVVFKQQLVFQIPAKILYSMPLFRNQSCNFHSKKTAESLQGCRRIRSRQSWQGCSRINARTESDWICSFEWFVHPCLGLSTEQFWRMNYKDLSVVFPSRRLSSLQMSTSVFQRFFTLIKLSTW